MNEKQEQIAYTLIEVLIALAVAGIASMGIFRLQIIGMEAALYSQLAAQASLIADTRIELALSEARFEQSPPMPDSGQIESGREGIKMDWSLEVSDGSADFAYLSENIQNLWLIRCSVSWGEGNSRRNIELKRYVWDYNIEE